MILQIIYMLFCKFIPRWSNRYVVTYQDKKKGQASIVENFLSESPILNYQLPRKQ